MTQRLPADAAMDIPRKRPVYREVYENIHELTGGTEGSSR